MLGESKNNPYLCTQNFNDELAHRGIDHPTTLNTMSFISRKSLRLLAILLVLAQGVWAQEINYDVSDESGLRNVLQDNAYIRLTNNISLSSTIGISDNITVTIDLNGKTLTAASGHRIFQVNAGASLTISDSSSEKTGLLTGAEGVESNGACIYNAGTLTMTGGKIYKNECTSAYDGGGIYNSGTLTLNGVELEYNSPDGVFNASGGTVEMSNCTIKRTAPWGINNAGGMTLNAVTITKSDDNYNARGLHNTGTLTMNDGRIEYCRADNGGGVINKGTMTIQGTSIQHNRANSYGAGIYNPSQGVLTIKDGTTVSDNQASIGGGVMNEGSITMTGGVISENTASVKGGGICNSGEFTMSDGSITGNKASTGKGGGIYNDSPNSGDNGINMTGGTIAYNFADEGGGIYNNIGTTIIAGGNVGEPARGNWADVNGGGIYNKATLSFQSGSIQGNKASDGAGVYNGDGGRALMNGGTIAQNQALLNGGGICNYATLTLEGGEIKNNSCTQNGGGVWADGSNGAVLYMQGKPEVSGNLKVSISNPNNLFLKQDARIRVTGAFTAGADVHFLCEASGLYKITQDFGGEHNPETVASSVFTDDAAADYGLSINQGEVYRMPLAKNTPYLRDGSQTADAMKLSDVADGSGVSFGSGWFVLDDDKNYTNRITILGDTRLILTNSKTLTASAGIYVPEWSSLTIYAQPSNGAVGYITATGSANNAGIGGNQNQDAGTITVYGGHVTATGGANAAGIGGGGSLSFYKTINIHGGTVTATGGAAGAGIGTGPVGRDETIAPDAANQLDAVPGMYSSHINITGGQVTATGKDGGAGIGSGDDSYFLGEVSISGGVVTASVSETNADDYRCSAAGIGSGMNGSCYLFRNPNAEPMERRATIRISGGSVTATGGQYGAAGIGGGSRFNVNPVIDPGTYVGADCPSYYGGGADVFITGGHVEASGGNHGDATHWGDAIGCGGSYNQDNTVLPTRGTLEINDGAAVQYWEPGSVNFYAKPYNRVEAARDYYRIVIEQCDHNSSSCAYDHLQHSTCSRCFGSKEDHTFDSDRRCTACGLVSLSDDASDNAAHITNLTSNTKRDVALTGRTLYKDGSWNTLCLPFLLTAEQLADSPLKGATIKAFSSASFSDGTLTLNFSASQAITAGVPYIVKWAAGDHIVNPLFRQVSLTSATASAVTSEFVTATSPASITFQGIYDAYATGGEDKSILYLGVSAEGQSELYYPDSEMTIHALRAFFRLNGLEAGGFPEPGFVRGFVLNFGDEEEPTSVSLPMAKEAAGAWHDLSGRKVNSPLSRGIYIHNGRKVVVK